MATEKFRKSKGVSSENTSLMIEKSSLQESKPIIGNDFDSEKKDIPTRHKNRLDPLTDRLQETGFYHKMRWPWFTYEFGGIKHPLEVDRYYGGNKIAIDMSNVTPEMQEYKKNILNANNIRYVVLKSSLDFETLSAVMS